MCFFEDSSRFIAEGEEKGERTLVHCQQGVSRSATIVIASLMKQRRWSRNEAFTFVKNARQLISPNPNYMEQLLSWQEQMYE